MKTQAGLKLELQGFILSSSVPDQSNSELLKFAAKIIDYSAHLYSEEFKFETENAILHAQNLLTEIISNSPTDIQLATAYYFLANSWSVLRSLRKLNNPSGLQWESEVVSNEIISLRKAIKCKGFEKLNEGRKIQVYTNLGNNLSQMGRPVDAIRLFDLALKIYPKFGMAMGGKGICIQSYGNHLYDKGHTNIFLTEAFFCLKEASESDSTEAHAKPVFTNRAGRLQEYYSKKIKLKTKKRIFKSTDSYWKWCLNERLILNPLNDLYITEVADRDTFGMPSITVPILEGATPPKYFGYYNSLKQEFVSSRYLFYEGLNLKDNHFSDDNVLIYNTLDYSSHSLSIEKIKLAFRSAYSLFDKIAYFIREYYELKIPDDRIYFKTIWYIENQKQKGLRDVFVNSENLALQGLFWLSKDLFEKSSDFRESLDPDAENLYDVRNQLEHKFLGVHQLLLNSDSQSNRIKLQEEDLIAKTLKLFRMSREALVYLSLAVHFNEEKKKIGNEKNSTPMDVSVVRDKDKRQW